MHKLRTLLTASGLLLLTACSPAAGPQPPDIKANPGPITAHITTLEQKITGVTAFGFADAEHGWLAHGNQILHTLDGGKNWVPQFDAGEPVVDLDFVSLTRGLAATQTRILVTADGGQNWSPLPGQARLQVDFVDPSTGWAMTAEGLSATTDGGATLQTLPAPCGLNQGWGLRSFSLVSSTTGYILCTGQGGAGMQQKGILRTRDGGQSWEPLADLGKGGYGSALFFLAEEQGWYGMSRGSLSRTTDAGTTWNWVTGLGPAEHFIGGIQFLTAEHGFIVDKYDGRPSLLMTRDGGNSFTPLFPSPSPLPLQMIDAQTWVAAGTELDQGAILRSDDGGKRWRQVGSIPGCRIDALSFVDRQTGYAAGEQWSGEPKLRQLMRTTDGGATWSVVRETPSDYKDFFLYLSFVDQMTGFAGSGWGHLWATTDGGTSWTQVHATDEAGQNFDFVSPQRGWKTREFTLEATEDGGRSWKPVDLKTRVISFDLLPDGTAWVVGGDLGQNGHRSQLFATRDWGRSWQTVDLGGLQVGTVRFADPEHGIFGSDYGMQFTTGDGGRSWTQVR